MKIKINETLRELMAGILVWGIFWQAAGFPFVKDRMGCSLGLWIGVLMAGLYAAHMYLSLDKALDFDEKGAQKYIMSRNILRYGFVVIIMGILMITDFANPLCAFLGLIGLKAAAYMQPFMHKVFDKLQKK